MPSKTRVVLRCVLDIGAMLGLILVVIGVLGFVAYLIQDHTRYLDSLFGQNNRVVNNVAFEILVGGLCYFCFITGIVAVCYFLAAKCCECCKTSEYTYDSYPYYHRDPAESAVYRVVDLAENQNPDKETQEIEVVVESLPTAPLMKP
eukprot:m51a1_g10593 hypothetical protein (147) ;mRNA; r:19941-20769